MSISPLCLESALSPSIPSIFKNASNNAISLLFSLDFQKLNYPPPRPSAILTARGLRQFRHQPQRHRKLVQLEVRFQERDRTVNTRFTRHLAYFDLCVSQRVRGLYRSRCSVIWSYVIHDPLVEPTLTIRAGHETAEFIAHHC